MDTRVKVIHDDTNLLSPHFSFLLGARSEIRDKRLLERGGSASDIKIEKNSNFLNRVAEIFMSFGLIYIDTSDITAEEVAESIIATIRQSKQ